MATARFEAALAPHRPMLRACGLVFGLALLLRTGLVLVRADAPVHGDPLFYTGCAVRLGKFVHGEAMASGTRWAMFARGPLLPVVECVALAVAAPEVFGETHNYETLAQKSFWWRLRLLWAVVESLTCAVVAAIGWLLFDRRAGMLAGVLCSVLPSMVILPLRLYPQTWVAAGLALGLLGLALGLPRGKRAALVGAGLAVGLAGQFLPAIFGLALPLIFLPGLVYATWLPDARWRPGARVAVPFLLGHLAIWCVRWSAEQALCGGLVSLLQGVTTVQGFWQLLPSNGWSPDTLTAFGPDALEAGCGSGGLLAALWSHPSTSAELVGLNALRLWQFPSNWFREGFGLGFEGQTFVHQALLLFAVAVTPAFLFVRPAVALLLSPLLLLTGAYALCHPETRYVLPVLPLAALLASGAFVRIADGWGRTSNAESGRLWLVGGACLLLGCATVCTPAVLLGLTGLQFKGALAAATLLWTGMVATGMMLVARSVLRAWVGAERRLVAGVVVAGLVVGCATFGTSAWHEWSVDLGGPASACEALRMRLELPRGGPAPGRAFLLVDATGPELERLEATVNGIRLPRLGATETVQARPLLPLYGIWLGFWQASASSVRAWHATPMPAACLASGELEIVLRLAAGEGEKTVRVYGDGSEAFSGEDYHGPRPGFHHDNRSIYQWLWAHRDPRLDGVTRLQSVSATSSRLEQGEWRADDLSPQAGWQGGSYRLRVVVLPRGIDQPSPEIPDDALTYY